MSPLTHEPPYENLENLQEELVFRMLPTVVAHEQNRGRSFCSCPTCLIDIAAIALNSLPPRYVADRYNIFGATEADQARLRDEVAKAIANAIHRVATRPHHF